jgi:AcrR family transcriptional regulator
MQEAGGAVLQHSTDGDLGHAFGRPRIPMLREKILRTAMDLFGEQRFESVCIDDVAERAKVGKGSVYRQFISKEQLYVEAVIQGFIELRRQMEEALKDASSISERITTITRHAFSYFWNRPEFFALIRDPGKLPHSQEKRYRNQRRALSEMIAEILKGGVRAQLIRGDLNVELLAESMLGMMRGINRYRQKGVSLDEAVRIVVSVFLDGCSRRPPAN